MKVLVKYGGNAMKNRSVQYEVIQNLIDLKKAGHQIIIVHGGGPYIAEQLALAEIESEFIGGLRKTTSEAMPHVEMALKGRVNGQLVSIFNQFSEKAVGISGKDGAMIKSEAKYHTSETRKGELIKQSLGQVGEIIHIDSDLIHLLLDANYTPVIACIGTGEDGEDYNINADTMAGHIAAELQVDAFIVLTDIDGLRKNVEDPTSTISTISSSELKNLFGTSIIGGMIPKVQACIWAIQNGVKKACILNGMKPNLIKDKIINDRNVGTTIIA